MGDFFALLPPLESAVVAVLLLLLTDLGHGFLIDDLSSASASPPHVSVIGDPGMKSPNARFALEAWNFCNEVGHEAPNAGSPRMADCADLHCPSVPDSFRSNSMAEMCEAQQKVKESYNKLGAGDKFPIEEFQAYTDPDAYAVEKELFLGSLCKVPEEDEEYSTVPYYFWMIMLKNGNFDTNTTLCPENGRKVAKIVTRRSFPCFGQGCMNQPLVYHNRSRAVFSGEGNKASLVGGFYGTYDSSGNGQKNPSFFSVSWRKNPTTKSWIVSHKLTTSSKYPWLMLYLRADAAKGFNGGYHYEGRGIMKQLPESPNFKVRLTLDVKQGGGSNSQFYLTDIGGCWKNSGDPCDGDVITDVTRYSEMIINPETTSWCGPRNLASCPPYHTGPAGEIIRRNDTSRFPYSAYHLYCAPGNAEYLEEPYDICDPYSNPQAQEIVQILPHREWAVHGYPEKKGDG